MKKVLIMMMCVIMVVCFMPTVALAGVVENCSDANCAHVAAIGTTHYDTLGEAVASVHAKESDARNQETVITLLKDAQGGGVAVGYNTIENGTTSGNNPVNITFDLGGHEYTVTNPTVGSAGTETNGFQLLKGSTVKFKNGRIKTELGNILIQNYCDLTLENVNISAPNASYVLSNNFGDVNIIGSSSIIAGAGKVAFDLWYGMSSAYDEGITVTVDTTGKVSGNIEYGAHSRISGSDWKNKTKLIIEQGDFDGAFIASSKQISIDDANIKVTKGTFSDLGVLNHLADNANVTVKLNNDVNSSITIPSGKKVTLDLNGQRITSTDESAVIVSKDSSLVVEDMSNGKTGSITGATVGIKMGNAPENGQDANSFLTINGGTISGGAFGISGNGNRHGTTIIVNNGNITGDATGIYHPQDGELTVKGGTITGGTGIEIRSGKLTVEGGTIKGTATPAESTANGNGTTTDGAGIAVAQHTTKKPINVIVKGGTIEGYSALYQSNPQNNPPEDVANVSIQVVGGNFNAINNGTVAVYSENKTGFITGGTFSTDPTAYVPANSRYYVSQENGKYVVRYSAPYIPPTPTTPTDNVTNSGSTATDNASTNADLSGSTSTSNGTTTATVDKTTADKIVDKAVENKSTEVVIDATANTTTAANSTTIAQVTIPTETLGAIAEKTEADVTIKTDVAEVKMDNAAAAAVSEQAEGDTVKIIAEKVKEDATEVHFELKVVCSDGKVISDFKGGNIAVTVALPKAMAEKKVVCVYIDDNGHMSKVEGQKNADGTYTFVTGHFSTYAIMAEEEADAAIAAQTEAIKNIEIKVSTKLDATKAGKKGIKVTWKTADGKKLDGVEFFRSVKKNSGYGKKAFFTSKKAGTTGYYLNTKSLKKGTRYYYRVRGYVLVDGQKVYTDWSNKGIRTFK